MKLGVTSPECRIVAFLAILPIKHGGGGLNPFNIAISYVTVFFGDTKAPDRVVREWSKDHRSEKKLSAIRGRD
jgi:hypothetical protein